MSALGDQFTLIALPWLVLKLTGDPGSLGLVLAVMALPRANFMLVGGALVDRLSPRRVLLVARAVNAALVTLLAVLVLCDRINMPLIYAIALGIGTATAFAYPAGSALLPQLVAPERLTTANAWFMSARQLSMFLGPALAGLVIVAGADPTAADAAEDIQGLGWAFSIDAVTFLFSLAALLALRVPSEAAPEAERGSVLSSVITGIREVWSDPPLRAFLLYVSAVTVMIMGPLQVGLPVLANDRMDLGAASFGILLTANGGGMVIGGFLSGTVTRVIGNRLGLLVLGMDSFAGLGIASLALVHSTLAGGLVLACIGLVGGAAQIAVFSWIQQRVPQARMGRTMSLLMFTFMGLGPLSAAGAGLLLRVISLPTLFVSAGLLLTTIALAGFTSPAMRSVGAAKPAWVQPAASARLTP